MAVLNTNAATEGQRVGSALKYAGQIGLLTDSTVAAANTVAGIKTAITNATAQNSNFSEVVRSGLLKAVDVGEDLGLLTDALINPLTTVAGLVALTSLDSARTAAPFYD